jgi:flagellar protein FliO/FliZ
MTLSIAARPATAAVLSLLLSAPVALAAPGNPGVGEDTPLGLPADTARTQAGNSVGSPGSGTLVRTFVGLAVVIGVIYGLSWVMKQVKASREEHTVGHGLRPAATIALGPNRSLHLVHAGRELVLVGVAEQGVTPIRTYSHDEAIALGLIDDVDEDDVVAVGRAVATRPTGLAPVLDGIRRWTQR